MSGRPWTMRELEYLRDHAGDGGKAIARALGRSYRAVRTQAATYGISLRRRWTCPRCGSRATRPLDPRTGWCRACSMEVRRRELEERTREMEEEAEREEAERKARQALYARRSRLRRRGRD